MIRGPRLTNNNNNNNNSSTCCTTATAHSQAPTNAIHPSQPNSGRSLHSATTGPVSRQVRWWLPPDCAAVLPMDVRPSTGPSRRSSMDRRYLDPTTIRRPAVPRASRVRLNPCDECSLPTTPGVGDQHSLTWVVWTVPGPWSLLRSGESVNQPPWRFVSFPSGGESADPSLGLRSSSSSFGSDELGATEKSGTSHRSNQSAPNVGGRTWAGHAELPPSPVRPSTNHEAVAPVDPSKSLLEVVPMSLPPQVVGG